MPRNTNTVPSVGVATSPERVGLFVKVFTADAILDDDQDIEVSGNGSLIRS